MSNKKYNPTDGDGDREKQAAILKRLRKLTGKTAEKEIAALLNMKLANFYARKQRNSLVPIISEWGMKNDIDLNYLLKGEREKSIKNRFILYIDEWLHEIGKNDNRILPWFELQFEMCFPAFKDWKKSRETIKNNLF